MSLTVRVKTAIERGFVLRVVYEGGERAGQARDVLILALMWHTPGKKSRDQEPYQAWLAYDPTAYHRTRQFSTMRIDRTRFQAVIVASRVPEPQTIDDIYPTKASLEGRRLWEENDRLPPLGFTAIWKLWKQGVEGPLPDIKEVYPKVPVIVQEKAPAQQGLRRLFGRR